MPFKETTMTMAILDIKIVDVIITRPQPMLNLVSGSLVIGVKTKRQKANRLIESSLMISW